VLLVLLTPLGRRRELRCVSHPPHPHALAKVKGRATLHNSSQRPIIHRLMIRRIVVPPPIVSLDRRKLAQLIVALPFTEGRVGMFRSHIWREAALAQIGARCGRVSARYISAVPLLEESIHRRLANRGSYERPNPQGDDEASSKEFTAMVTESSTTLSHWWNGSSARISWPAGLSHAFDLRFCELSPPPRMARRQSAGR